MTKQEEKTYFYVKSKQEEEISQSGKKKLMMEV
jgi:hypothetical protein